MDALLQVGFGLFGLAVLIGIAWLFSNNRRAVDWRLVLTGLSLQIAFAALVLLVPGAVWDWHQAQFTLPALLAVAVMGVVTSGLAYWLNLRVLSQISPVAAMSSAFMIPLFGVAWGHIFLGEALGPGMLWGGALVLVATGLVTGFNPLQWLGALSRTADWCGVARWMAH